MAGIFTRKAITNILNDEALTPEERTDQLFSLYGRALDDGYITKSASQAALTEAVEKAKADALKDYKAPDPTESDQYKKLQSQFDSYKAKQEARLAEDFADVKPKFFDSVYDRLDRNDGAKPIKEQLEAIRKDYEEYFTTKENPAEKNQPTFSESTKGSMPTGEGEGTFSKYWGYKKG